jgi:thiosulfate dehydrogenase
MAHIDRMTGFVMYNMPKGAPGSLSLNDAYDISAFVLTHARPTFDPTRLVVASPRPAQYF